MGPGDRITKRKIQWWWVAGLLFFGLGIAGLLLTIVVQRDAQSAGSVVGLMIIAGWALRRFIFIARSRSRAGRSTRR